MYNQSYTQLLVVWNLSQRFTSSYIFIIYLDVLTTLIQQETHLAGLVVLI